MNHLRSFHRFLLRFSTPVTMASCPNCWGYQEFDTYSYERPPDQQVDVQNGLARHSFIRQFTINRIEGIRRKAYRHCA
ncbi:hypothetical protein [Phaeodactylibacter sp.]|uniref:hypothetical protein n=1 Tax=Phaeodactylibacter sp. TaxID=1940289 RepID=UPI0025E17A18|nr:hypothetical protein [Phaeodactylibacter sp.]MCI4646847.1 hypothetical protein [Phaeodactylibacter sp.]MCI5091582.1 hypothetical protein [Phaeodactylibacter sp.]